MPGFNHLGFWEYKERGQAGPQRKKRLGRGHRLLKEMTFVGEKKEWKGVGSLRQGDGKSGVSFLWLL